LKERRVSLRAISRNAPTVDRWRSFGWHVENPNAIKRYKVDMP
jgi:transketolase N-terminal domain/subunit